MEYVPSPKVFDGLILEKNNKQHDHPLKMVRFTCEAVCKTCTFTSGRLFEKRFGSSNNEKIRKEITPASVQIQMELVRPTR